VIGADDDKAHIGIDDGTQTLEGRGCEGTNDGDLTTDSGMAAPQQQGNCQQKTEVPH
jgi:hypothetical protein